MSRLGLRARLALALVGVALLAVAVATYLSNRGLHHRVTDTAEARLERSAGHFAEVAAAVYEDQGSWTPQAQETLGHLARLDGLDVRVDGSLPEPSAEAVVVVDGDEVARLSVALAGGALLTPEEASLQDSLDRLHVAAAIVSSLAALALALLLAETLSRPLRRIRRTAQRMEEGDLSARVTPAGDPEIRAVGSSLNRLAETLQEEERIRKAGLADIAHELRTPVSALLSRIEAAQDGVFRSSKANLAAMHSEAVRLARLLDDLSRLSDAELPGLLVERHPVELAEVAATQARTFEPLFATKGLRFEADLEPVVVYGDADRLGQVVANLLSNALRYTEHGGTVTLRLREVGPEAVLDVVDSGIGIAEDDLRHVFKRFWRGEKSRSRATGGSGIGLAIVHELVDAHGGRVEVSSSPGAGSTFRVLVPVAGAGRANGAPTPEGVPVPGGIRT